LFWECAGSQYIDRNTEQNLNPILNPRNIKKTGIRSGVDQKVEIAGVRIIPVQNRPKDAGVCAPVLADNPANFLAVVLKSFGRLHVKYPHYSLLYQEFCNALNPRYEGFTG
jgi:hypothetical protein